MYEQDTFIMPLIRSDACITDDMDNFYLRTGRHSEIWSRSIGVA